MKYSKRIKIKNKRFKREDILRLAQIIENEFGDKDYSHKFTVDFWDNSSITDGTSQIFTCGEFERRRAKRIHIQFYGDALERQIEVTLYDSAYLDDSEISITSIEQFWYSAMVSKFEEFLREVEQQTRIAPMVNSPIAAVVCVLIAGLLGYICIQGVSNVINGKNILLPELLQISIILVVFAINIFLCVIAWRCLVKAFPTIDFCFGAEHTNAAKKTRNAIVWSVVTFVPSIVVSLIERLLSA